MVPIHRKNWIKSVAMVSDKTVTSSRVALSISSAVFMPEVGGQKKLQVDDIVGSTATLYRCRENLRTNAAASIKNLTLVKIQCPPY